MTIRGLIFDLDGTLADTVPVCIQAFQQTIQHFRGSRPAPAEIVALFGVNEEGILERSIPGRLKESLPYYLSVYEDIHQQCLKPFDGVERIFDTLQQKNIPAAIVTGKGYYSTVISLRILGLDRFVQRFETGFHDRGDKPHSIRNVLRSWACPPGQAAYVGDAVSDMRAAQEAGVLPLGAAWAESSELIHLAVPASYQVFFDIPSFEDWVETI